jgi:hypothetical protein
MAERIGGVGTFGCQSQHADQKENWNCVNAVGDHRYQKYAVEPLLWGRFRGSLNATMSAVSR